MTFSTAASQYQCQHKTVVYLCEIILVTDHYY